jgi:hypothetical protein
LFIQGNDFSGGDGFSGGFNSGFSPLQRRRRGARPNIGPSWAWRNKIFAGCELVAVNGIAVNGALMAEIERNNNNNYHAEEETKKASKTGTLAEASDTAAGMLGMEEDMAGGEGINLDST